MALLSVVRPLGRCCSHRQDKAAGKGNHVHDSVGRLLARISTGQCGPCSGLDHLIEDGAAQRQRSRYAYGTGKCTSAHVHQRPRIDGGSVDVAGWLSPCPLAFLPGSAWSSSSSAHGRTSLVTQGVTYHGYSTPIP